jgi:hypothetical protein
LTHETEQIILNKFILTELFRGRKIVCQESQNELYAGMEIVEGDKAHCRKALLNSLFFAILQHFPVAWQDKAPLRFEAKSLLASQLL